MNEPRELLTKLWRADFADGPADGPEDFYLFRTEDQARGMLGECAGEVYPVEVWRAEQPAGSKTSE